MKIYWIYILGSTSGVLYIGVTNNLARRLLEHILKINNGFTAQYKVHKLLYFEEYPSAIEAIQREKQLKGWRREKKMMLIKTMNPGFIDLSLEWDLSSF